MAHITDFVLRLEIDYWVFEAMDHTGMVVCEYHCPEGVDLEAMILQMKNQGHTFNMDPYNV